MNPRVCLLTGASGYFGSRFIHACCERYVIVAAHHKAPVEFATQDQEFFDPLEPRRPIARNDRAAFSIAADLSKPDQIEPLVTRVLDRWGYVDFLINAAAERVWSPLIAEPGSLSAADGMFQVNVLAPLQLSVALARQLWGNDIEQNIRRNRNIVNISSTAGIYVYEDTGQAIYAATKAALNHLTYHMASEFWQLGVRVNAVTPDTFPGRVSAEAVLSAVIRCDESTETGRLISLKRNSHPVTQGST